MSTKLLETHGEFKYTYRKIIVRQVGHLQEVIVRTYFVYFPVLEFTSVRSSLSWDASQCWLVVIY
jgi:hypothetical protein